VETYKIYILWASEKGSRELNSWICRAIS
jgi:hypothetical protein